MSVHQQQIGSGVVNRVKRFDRAAERSHVVPRGVECRAQGLKRNWVGFDDYYFLARVIHVVRECFRGCKGLSS